ncbi:MAG: serine hydrolase domain-containing protein, partial [Wenzhouxiangellaceae bacterium]
MIDSALRQQSIPGVSVVVIRDHQVVYSAGRGVADIETGRPMTDRTVVYIGSLSKVLTAVLALRQVERGALMMTDTLDRQPVITLLQLITHQSGLPREGDFDYWFSGIFPNRPTLAAYVAGAPLD